MARFRFAQIFYQGKFWKAGLKGPVPSATFKSAFRHRAGESLEGGSTRSTEKPKWVYRNRR